MTLTLNLPPETEEKLRRRAEREGIGLSELAASILQADPIEQMDSVATMGVAADGPDALLTASMNDVAIRAREFYNLHLRAQLEASNLDQYVAIHPDSGDYLVERWPGKARRALKERHPEGSIVVRHIGIADEGFRARIRGERP